MTPDEKVGYQFWYPEKFNCKFCEDGRTLTTVNKLYEVSVEPTGLFFEKIYLKFCPRCGLKLEDPRET